MTARKDDLLSGSHIVSDDGQCGFSTNLGPPPREAAEMPGYKEGWTDAMQDAAKVIDESFRYLPREQKLKKLEELKRRFRYHEDAIDAERRTITIYETARDALGFIESLNIDKDTAVSILPAEQSKTGHLIDVCRAGRLAILFSNDDKKSMLSNKKIADDLSTVFNQSQIFLITRNLDNLIAHKEELRDAEWRLPYKYCIFEIRWRVKTCSFYSVVMCEESGSGINFLLITGTFVQNKESCVLFARHVTDGHLFTVDHEEQWRKWPMMELCVDQIRAACILMDADVVVREQHRIDAKLNDVRRKRGKTPFYSFHKLKLRERVAYAGTDVEHDEKRRSPRLHLRRGHWRRVGRYKTWVRWTVVGDPSHGIVDKDYMQ